MEQEEWPRYARGRSNSLDNSPQMSWRFTTAHPLYNLLLIDTARYNLDGKGECGGYPPAVDSSVVRMVCSAARSNPALPNTNPSTCAVLCDKGWGLVAEFVTLAFNVGSNYKEVGWWWWGEERERDTHIHPEVLQSVMERSAWRLGARGGGVHPAKLQSRVPWQR
jgi:hypothetical protein